MATESSDPRVGLIARVGILSIVTLVVTHAGLVAYFDSAVRAEEYRKVGSVKPDALLAARADEKDRLSAGAMPIDKAMQQLSAKGRMGAGPEVVPSASKDIAPMQGWVQMPAEVPPMMMPPAASAPSGSTSAATVPSAAPSAPAPGPSNAPRHP